MISTAIQQLVNYGLDTGLILPDDEIYIRNQLLMTMQLDSFTEPEGDVCYADLESILKTLVDDAAARGVCDDSPTARDLFDTRLMGVLTPRPSIVRANFEERYETDGPQAATDWFYKFSQDTDYIRRYRIKRDVKWVTRTPYGDLDITINLSKPEKDPKAIAAAKLAPQSAYPKCQLCVENEGYAGRLNHPARENHRMKVVAVAVSSGDKRLCGFCKVLRWFYPYIQCDTGCAVGCQFCTVRRCISSLDRFCIVASFGNFSVKFRCNTGVRICDRVSCCIFYFCRNRLIDPVPDKSALCIRVVTENIPVLFEVTKGITHCMCILRLDIRQLIASICYLTLDRIYTPVLGGIDIYHGFFAVTLCIAVVTLVFTDTGRITLQDPLCGIVEAVVFIHIVGLISSFITKGPDHYGWMVFIALYHILGAVHNGSIPDRISGRNVAACRTDVGLCIRLITDINTQLICQSVHIWIVRIMAGTDRIDIELLHHLQVGCDIFF